MMAMIWAKNRPEIVPMSPGGLFVFVRDVPRNAYIQLHIEHRGIHWLSDFESTELRGIHLREGDATVAIKIGDQDYEYQGNDWWKRWIWIEGTDEELDDIDHVTYTLHPTFPSPTVSKATGTRSSELSTSGWGTFRIRAKAVKKNGEEIKAFP
ncbi:MAG: hypothetical protein MZV70_34750 [Desulfobacterales bacterium]|nr:hypothetical protein [Desulfobacterales bacterium]